MNPIATMRAYMKRNDLTQQDMAERIGVSQPSVSRALRGHVRPGTTAYRALRDRLQTLTK